jgi:hypothetical protein
MTRVGWKVFTIAAIALECCFVEPRLALDLLLVNLAGLVGLVGYAWNVRIGSRWIWKVVFGLETLVLSVPVAVSGSLTLLPMLATGPTWDDVFTWPSLLAGLLLTKLYALYRYGFGNSPPWGVVQAAMQPGGDIPSDAGMERIAARARGDIEMGSGWFSKSRVWASHVLRVLAPTRVTLLGTLLVSFTQWAGGKFEEMLMKPVVASSLQQELGQFKSCFASYATAIGSRTLLMFVWMEPAVDLVSTYAAVCLVVWMARRTLAKPSNVDGGTSLPEAHVAELAPS